MSFETIVFGIGVLVMLLVAVAFLAFGIGKNSGRQCALSKKWRGSTIPSANIVQAMIKTKKPIQGAINREPSHAESKSAQNGLFL